MENQILLGDSLDRMKELPDNSVDLIVSDPPYGYSFMGKDWDKAVPSVEIWQEALRVLKPGAFAFIMSAPRQDVLSQMIVRIGQAGFDTDFTSIYWTYASGFPKAANIGKMVDKRAGAERDITGINPGSRPNQIPEDNLYEHGTKGKVAYFTEPATPEAKALDGSYGGFQPKPAVEVIIVAMKPLSEKTFVDQALKNGKGITWLDDCRIPADAPLTYSGMSANKPDGAGTFRDDNWTPQDIGQKTVAGRFPANLLVEDSVLEEHSRYFSLDAWKLPPEVQQVFPFLIVPKASKGEKNKGLEGFEIRQSKGGGGGIGDYLEDVNSASGKYGSEKAPAKNPHPTVKPLKLMSYLITLGSRPGDLVLDPFVGSGTTCCAAKLLNRKYLGIEKDGDYYRIACARVAASIPDNQLPISA